MTFILLGDPSYKKYQKQLEGYGLEPLPLPFDERLNHIVSSHADTLIFSDGHIHIANRAYASLLPEHIRVNMTEVSEYPRGKYPDDTAFNALRIDDSIFMRRASIAPSILDYADKAGLTPINVSQGYARCSTLPLSAARAAVTADEGMAVAMEAVGVDVLRISPGHIRLDGCSYGFIGGASFVVETHNYSSGEDAPRYVFFFGRICDHPDGQKIHEFITRNGYEVISLYGELTDFGGAVVIQDR